MIYAAISNTNQPKPFFKLSPLIYFAKYIPTNIPTTAKLVTLNNKIQSMAKSLRCKSPVNPIRLFSAIIKREVPIAFFIGSFAKRTRAGIIKKPPPAPTIPVSTPTMDHSAKIPMILNFVAAPVFLRFGCFVFLIILTDAANMISAKNNIFATSLVKLKEPKLIISNGIDGTK